MESLYLCLVQNKKTQNIPVEGSLGLLALGADGLRAWRHAKKQAKKEGKESEKHG